MSKKRSYKKIGINDDLNEADNSLFESNDAFSFVVGYTPGGVPFGLTWDEYDPSPEDDFENSKRDRI
jgi:hypothetical protein